MFTSATNFPATNTVARANTNLPPAPLPGMAGFAGMTPDTSLPPGTTTQTEQLTSPAPTGPEKDYSIQKGDTLSSIASKNGVTLSAILKSNPNLDPKKLKVGQTIKVPAPAPAAASRNMAGTASTPPTSNGPAGVTAGPGTGGAVGTYKVKPGDTLTKIAKAHGITVNQLRAANNMKTTQVQVGKVLKIPARSQKTAAATVTTNTTQH